MTEKQNSWRKRTILFLLSQSISLFGSTLVQMAIIWYVTLKTSSGAWVSAMTICAYLPQFLMSFVGGVWADRYSRKKLIIAADGIIAAVTLGLFFAMPYISDGSPLLYVILLVLALRSLAAGVQTPAVNAVLPQLVPESELMRYNGINATMQSVVQFAAPAAAGALLTFSSLRASLLIDIFTAIVGIGILAFVALPKTAPAKSSVSVFADMKLGIKYAYSNPFLRRLLATYGLFIFLSVPAGFLASLFVSRVYGDTYWYLTAVELTGFAGMAAGGLIMATWGGFKKRSKTLVLGLAAFGALAVGMGLSRNLYLYLSLMVVYGVALSLVQTATTTSIQERADEKLQGRVFGLLGSMYSGFLPVGMAVFGPMADRVALPVIMIGSGAALILIALAARLDKKLYC